MKIRHLGFSPGGGVVCALIARRRRWATSLARWGFLTFSLSPLHFGLKYAILAPMSLVVKILPYAQIIVSVILITAIMLQQSGAGLGGALGGDDSGSFHHTRRGFEKFLFYLSLVCGILFALFGLLAIISK